MNERFYIYTDSDGVVADFEKKVVEINGLPMHKITRGQLWRSVELYDRDVQPFFESLDMMPDAMELLDFIKQNFINHAILTACGYVPKGAAQQKQNWYKKHFDHALVVKTVSKSADKAAFATPNSILIDDRSKSIDPWVRAGGIGVLHTSAADSIAQIKKIVGL